jgi:hypothetical protein
MKPGMGKSKGSSFERLVCKKLTKWVTGKEDPLIFWRSASSGAHATQKNKAGKESKMYGDIMSIDPAGEFLTNKFVIECKSYKTYDLEKFLFQDKGLIQEWWNQVVGDSLKADKDPMLIFKKNNSPIIILLYDEYLTDIDEFELNIVHHDNIYLCTLDLFLEYIKPEDFK